MYLSFALFVGWLIHYRIPIAAQIRWFIVAMRLRRKRDATACIR